MSLDPSISSRICSTKSRTGCHSCKAKHLKCDERTPACTRCLRSGRECRPAALPVAGSRMVHYIAKSPNPLPMLNSNEQRYLHQFQHKTALELAGGCRPDFWNRYVVQISLSEPAIRHMVVALATLHHQFEKDATTPADIQFPLSQYTKAINTLTRTLQHGTQTSIDTPLVACVLFCAFESMSYHLHSAISHISAGLKILVERHGEHNSDAKGKQASIPKSMLYPLYTRLKTQGLELGESSFPSLERLRLDQLVIRYEFSTVSEAQIMFDSLWNAILHNMYKLGRSRDEIIDYESRSKLATLVEGYRSWCRTFDDFIDAGVDESQLSGAVLLQIWRVLMSINLTVDLRKGEMDFDHYVDDFSAMVCLAGEFVWLQAAEKRTYSGVPATNEAVDDHQQDALHHGPAHEDIVRGGYFGIHPSNTPFVTNASLSDSAIVRRTTESILRASRCLRNGAEDKLSGNFPSPEMKPSFTFVPGIVSPLYTIISRCRDSTIRRRALLIMQRCNRREGLWDSALAARLGDRVIRIEERRALALSDVRDVLPNEARVRMIQPTFLPDRKSVERYYLGWSGTFEEANVPPETWMEEVMEW